MRYDVIVIGGGLSGLTAASLLAKRGLHVAVIDKSQNPGGSCGIFKRDGVIFDQGAAMLYGFGEKGFNAHRFVFNCLEEPIDIIRHDLLYCVNFKGNRIRFFADVDLFATELTGLFPNEALNIKRFYRDMLVLYKHVMVEHPNYTTADETDPKSGLRSMLAHPLSYARFLSYLNKSAKSLLQKYFKDPEIFKFFDKLTSTYCYATVEEAPAILAAVMFIDNHVGGSYYPAGSTVFLPGKLEKVIEENGGEMLPKTEVVSILFEDGKPCGVELHDGTKLFADEIVYSGTVWNLYGKLIDRQFISSDRLRWAQKMVPTYPSVVLYARVKAGVLPPDTAPIEMLIGNPDELDESEVTVYMLSIDDKTLCPPDEHTVVAIGPTFEAWDGDIDYAAKKEAERVRLTAVLEKRFPGFSDAVVYAEVATPRTIERYTHKNGGAVAGPKMMLGQHLFRRQHTRTQWDTLFCCGESTVMGTGTPTVTTTGISAANAILKKRRLLPYVYRPGMKNHVRMLPIPFTKEQLFGVYPPADQAVMKKAFRCEFCEHPACTNGSGLDVQGVMRRTTVGNFIGAKRLMERTSQGIALSDDMLTKCESRCVLNKPGSEPVAIREIFEALGKML